MERVKLLLAFLGKQMIFHHNLPKLGLLKFRFCPQRRPVCNPNVFLFCKLTKILVPLTPGCSFAYHDASE